MYLANLNGLLSTDDRADPAWPLTKSSAAAASCGSDLRLQAVQQLLHAGQVLALARGARLQGCFFGQLTIRRGGGSFFLPSYLPNLSKTLQKNYHDTLNI